MTVYTYAQLEGLWINAGGDPSVAPVAAAVALAESSGNSASLNLTDNGGTQTSVGLWQVSNGTHNYPQAWSSPAGNAAEAVAKYKGAGNSWSPWGTYTSGAYKQFLSGGTTPDTNIPGGSAGQTVAGSGTTQGGTAGASDCLINFKLPGSGLPVIGSDLSFCLLSKAQGRAILGALLIGAGGIVGIVAIAVMVKGITSGKTGLKSAPGAVAGMFKSPVSTTKQVGQVAEQTPKEAADLPVSSSADLPAPPKPKRVTAGSKGKSNAKMFSAESLTLDDALAAAFV